MTCDCIKASGSAAKIISFKILWVFSAPLRLDGEILAMTRRNWLLASALLSACSRDSRTAQPVFPETVADVWRLKEKRELSVSSAPETVPRASVRGVREGVYAGPGTVSATVVELASSAAALDAVQRWKPAADTVVFYKDNYFVVVRWRNADRKALTAFVRAMEKNLGGGR